jgi:prepilin-type N-terminal cleavage/methylation domain-containing protein
MRERGFTLVELMIGLALACTLAVCAAPSLVRWTTNIRLTSTTSDIASTLQLARLKAITHNASMRLLFDRVAHTYQLQQREVSDTTKWRNVAQARTLPSDVHLVNITGNPIIFQSGKGSTVPGSNSTITLQTPYGKKTTVVVAQTGRVMVQKF